MRLIISLFILITTLFISQPATASQPASPAPANVAITVPSAQLTYDSPSVTTSPAPAPQVAIPAIPAPAVGVPYCEEDMPCWDCTTMGNLQCGPAPAAPAIDYCEEDEPCWDCATMGNRICGNPTASDAWASYDALQLSPDTHEGLMVDYISTSATEPHSDTLAPEQFAIPSSTTTDWHVFQYTPIYDA